MTDLVVTPTEARRDFFNLIKIAESGKRRVYVESKRSKVEFVAKPKKATKKATWDDLAGGMSDKDYKMIVKTMKEMDKLSARGTSQW